MAGKLAIGAGLKDIPIIFSAPMVCALFDDRKTMTRRLAWRSETDPKRMNFVCDGEDGDRTRLAKMPVQMAGAYYLRPSPWQLVKPGDRLWVREAHWRLGRWMRTYHQIDKRPKWRFVPDRETPATVVFQEPAKIYTRPHRVHDDLAWWKRPGIFLPRMGSRTTLIVAATKIERLQEISKRDAKAEGIQGCWNSQYGDGYQGFEGGWSFTAASAFENLWDHVHGAGAWNANPEVVALTFTVHQKNIDEMEARAA